MDSKQFKEAATSAIDESKPLILQLHSQIANFLQLSITTIPFKIAESSPMLNPDT